MTDIDSYEELKALKSLGIQYFSGNFYLRRDETDKGKENEDVSVSLNKANIVILISKLNNPNTDFEEISELIVSDNILSYQLLKIINCPIFRGRNEITSIQAVVVRFGMRNLKNWGKTLSFSCYTYKPQALYQASDDVFEVGTIKITR